MPWTKLKEMAELRENRRRAQRDCVDLVTVAQREDDSRVGVRLVDISPLGLHCRAVTQFERGERVRIQLPLVGTAEVEIAWALKGCFGGWFIESISPATYPQLLAIIESGQAGASEL